MKNQGNRKLQISNRIIMFSIKSNNLTLWTFGFFRGCLSDCRKGAIEQSQHELSFLQPRFGVPVDSDAVYTFPTALDKIGGAD